MSRHFWVQPALSRPMPTLADLADQVVIIYGDNLSDIDLRPLLHFHRSHDDPFTMVLFHAPDPRACGIAELDDAGRIVSFVEKPEQPASDLANAGRTWLTPGVPRNRRPPGIRPGVRRPAQIRGSNAGWVWGGYHLDIALTGPSSGPGKTPFTSSRTSMPTRRDLARRSSLTATAP